MFSRYLTAYVTICLNVEIFDCFLSTCFISIIVDPVVFQASIWAKPVICLPYFHSEFGNDRVNGTF